MAVFDNIKGIGVASGFKLQAQSALDPRLVVATIAERDELVTGNGAYEGMSVYVKANKKTYQLQGTTTSDWVDITRLALLNNLRFLKSLLLLSLYNHFPIC